MRVEPGLTATGSATVIGALRQAAARTGTDFGFLMAQAQAESGLRADAKAATSSARGLFQFTRSTWLEVVAQHGGDHPRLRWAADAVKSGAAQAGSAVREAVLALRDSPEAASLMAGELARDNAGKLSAGLGRAVDAGEVHLAHFLGVGGATRFLRALAATPDAPAAAAAPEAAAANRSIFFDGAGAARSLADVMATIAGKVSGAGNVSGPSSGAGLAALGRRAGVAAAPDAAGAERSVQARAAYLLLAELGG